MAGGTWETQNKVRAGVYIRFKSEPTTEFTPGNRGTVAICEPLSWGPEAVITEITAISSLADITGYSYGDPHNLFLQEIFKGTSRTAAPERVLLYRPPAGGSATASASTGTLAVTAKYAGERGNDIVINIAANVDTEDYTVTTLVDGLAVDAQVASTAEELISNSWVIFSGEGALEAGIFQLSGGVNGQVSAAAHAAFLTAIEPYHFDIICCDSTDPTVIAAYQAFIERIAADNGQYAQLVAANMTNPNSRFCINVTSGVTLDTGAVLEPNQVTWWVAGAEAGASYNQSLTFAIYPNAVAVNPVRTNSQFIEGIAAGQLMLLGDRDGVKIESDINSLMTVTEDIGPVFKKNRVMRLCNRIANDIFAEFSANYIGVVNNNEEGRSRFKSAIVGYLLELQDNDGIQDFDPDDVEVVEGAFIDAVLVTIAIKVVDSAEKIYLTVEVA